jgi:Tfp pilus assembly protein PilF
MRPLRAALVAAVVICLVLGGCSREDRPIEARLDRADDLLGHHRAVQAGLQVEAAIRLKPSRSDTYRTAMALYIKHERRPEAASVIERFLELARAERLDEKLSREELAHLHSVLAEVYQEGHLLLQAEDAYRAALALSPNSAQLLNRLAYFYADEGIKLDEGLRLARRSVGLAPEDGAIVDTLGWAEYKLGRHDAAARTLARAIRLMPDDATLRYHLGAAYARLGRKIEAWIELKKALVLDRNMREAAKLLKTLHKRIPASVID